MATSKILEKDWKIDNGDKVIITQKQEQTMSKAEVERAIAFCATQQNRLADQINALKGQYDSIESTRQDYIKILSQFQNTDEPNSENNSSNE